MGREKQDVYPTKTMPILKLEDMTEEQRRKIKAEKAAHDAAPPHPPMECVWCMFSHYPVSKTEPS